MLLFFGLMGAVGCASDGDTTGAGGTAGTGASATDTTASYPCEGPNTGAGQAGEGDETGAPLSCEVGKTFCYVFAGKPANRDAGTVYVPECRSFSAIAGKCATTPTCDCFCTRFACETECRCTEVNGFATVTCEQI